MTLQVADMFDSRLNPHWNRMAIGCSWVGQDGTLKLVVEEIPCQPVHRPD